MAGNPTNVKIWEDADVRILKPEALGEGETIQAAMPASITEDFGDDWLLVGLLEGSDGFGETREWDETEHTAWGYGLIKVSSRNFKMTRTFTALEENEVTEYLYSPGDTDTVVKVAKPANVYIAFETTSDMAEKQRRITTMPARVTAPESNRNEENLASKEFTCNIYPNSDKELFYKQTSATAPVVTPVSLTPIRFTKAHAGATKGQVLAVDSASAEYLVRKKKVAAYVTDEKADKAPVADDPTPDEPSSITLPLSEE